MKKPAGLTFIAIICVIGSFWGINASPWGRQLGGNGERMAFGIPGMDFIFRTKDDCLLPKKIGSCRAMIPSFYFDQQENKCIYFSYGGCQGNANRFNTYEECRSLCERIK